MARIFTSLDPLRPMVSIGKRKVGPGQPMYVIAEAGSNHDRNLDRAYRLIDLAVEAGADAVKFQLFRADRIAANGSHSACRIDFAGAKSLFELYQRNELDPTWLPKLAKRAAKAGIDFLVTPFDEVALDAVVDVGVKAIKIASFELNHFPLLRRAARTRLPILLSTGMATLGEVEESLRVIVEAGGKQVVLFHCGIEYPLPFGAVNLRSIETMKTAFRIPVGYSDHTAGIAVPLGVAALGGAILEKHYTESRSLPGPDHSFAIEGPELKALVEGVRAVEASLGSPAKEPDPIELVHRRRGRRSLFYVRDLPAGHRLAVADLAVLRPGVGLHPRNLEALVGRRLGRAVAGGDPVAWEHI